MKHLVNSGSKEADKCKISVQGCMTSSANIKWSSDASVAVWVIYTDRSKVTRVFEEVLRAPECALRFCYVVGQRSELPRQSHSHY